MKKSLSLICLLLVAGFTKLNAQQLKSCATDEVQKEFFDANPEALREYLANEELLMNMDKQAANVNYSSSKQQSVVYIIPVVFHIVHQFGPENISDAKVREAIRVMNDDFRKRNADTASTIPVFQPLMADCEIEFRLATIDPSGNCTNGIDRIYSPETNNGGESAKFNKWPQNKYLNIWVIKKMGPGHLTAAAYAYYPSTPPANGDGIICLYDYVGTNAGNSHTLSHEAGHYLNLKHVWGSTNQPNVACGDDNVADTPITKGSNSACVLSLSLCNPPTIENVQNFMDYSFCTTMYTYGQKTRMRTALMSSTGNRSNLWSAGNLAATGTANAPVLCAADFISNNLNNVICENGIISFSDVSYNGQINSRNWNCTGAVLSGTSTFSDSIVTLQYPSSGMYDVTLTVSNSTDTVSVTKSQYIQVLPAVAAYSGTNFTESFESNTIPGTDWEEKNPDNGSVIWTRTTAAANSGSYSAFIENYSADSADVDELIGPTISIAPIANPLFTFKAAFRRKTSGDADALKIYTSVDCGKNWALRKTITASVLESVTGPSSAYFIPTANDWETHTVSIANLLSSTNARLKFQFISGGGNNLYLDDINIITNLNATGLTEENLNFQVFPNPTNTSATVSFNLENSQKIKLSVKDIVGKEIETVMQEERSAGFQKIELNKQGQYSAGIYFLNLQIGDQVIVSKLLISEE